MKSRIFTLAVLFLAVSVTGVYAQDPTANISSDAVVIEALEINAGENLDFGTLAQDGNVTITSNPLETAVNGGSTGTFSVPNVVEDNTEVFVNFAFSALSDGATNDINITNHTYSVVNDGSIYQAQEDEALGSGNESVTVQFGNGGDGSNIIGVGGQLDLTNATVGTYSGDVTVTLELGL